MKLPYEHEGPSISIPWWVMIPFILCLGEPDLLDGFIRILNNTACN